MIKNIPTHDQFEKLGLQCLYKSFEMLYSVHIEIEDCGLVIIGTDDEIEDYEEDKLEREEKIKEYWEHNNTTLSTSLIVLFQGVEYLMKAKITEQSALLLIENNRNDWPTLPKKADRNFDELQTISGENLLGVFCAVLPETFDINGFVDEYKVLRVKRNKLVHSTGVEGLKHNEVIESILNILSYFYTTTKWIDLFRDMFISNPLFGDWDWDVESAHFYQILDFVEESIPKSQLKKFLPFNEARRYSCPECTYWLNKHISIETDPKWSYLSPNEPSSTVIKCLICAKQYPVQRKDCDNKPCKGNVISDEEVCLTCNNHLS